jgi:hypothetical protein
MEDDIDGIALELEKAHHSLHQTVADIQQKVETVTERFGPRHVLERHLPTAICMAGALGFAAGNHGKRTDLLALVLGGLLGAVLQEVSSDGFWTRDST